MCLIFFNVKISSWLPLRLSCNGVNTVQCSARLIVSSLFALAVGHTEMCMYSTIPLLFVYLLLRTGDSCTYNLLLSLSHKHSIIHWGFISSKPTHAIKIPIMFSYVLEPYRHFAMKVGCNIQDCSIIPV
jgi:hypothetical protein